MVYSCYPIVVKIERFKKGQCFTKVMKLKDTATVLFPVDSKDISDSLRTDKFYAILEGLPSLPLQPSESSGGPMGLLYEQDGNYAWVTPSAALATEEDPKTLLTALVYLKGHKDKLYIREIDTLKGTFGSTLDSAIAHARILMSNAVREKLEKRKR